MRGGGGGGPPQGDQMTNFFWLLMLIIGGIAIFWWYKHQWITEVIFTIRTYEIMVLLFVSNFYNAIASFLHLPLLPVSELKNSEILMWVSNPANITFKTVSQISVLVGAWLRFPLMILILGMAALLYFSRSDARFQHTYNAQALRQAEVENWPQITPVLDLDLVKASINEGPWAMSQPPIEFSKQHQLLELIPEKEGKQAWAIRRGPAQRVFMMQLGPLWKSPRHLPIHLQALLVIFVARATRERTIADGFINQIAASAKTGQRLNFSGIAEQLQKYENNTLITWVAKRHAYVSTFLCTLLSMARVDGVLATAEFLWLKPIDRRTWYALNSIGRQTAFTEIAGVYAHWLAEKKVGRALRTPMVKEAVNALEASVKEILYVPEGDEWHSAG